ALTPSPMGTVVTVLWRRFCSVSLAIFLFSQYVVKKLNLTTSSKRERRAAEQEAQLLSRLRHPNIVTYRESWEGDDCQLYIVMGFCEGGDLYHRLKLQKGELLPERQVVEWFVQIAMALQYLHERNILHRDLKTQNIFLTKTNIIKVGDLGIARVLENQNDMASTLIGTPYYMSPELFSNKPYNHKSDVWALGCCVYEMSTLKHAFNAKDMNSLVYRIVEGKLPQMPSRYDLQLGELIQSMLCKRPEDRPDVKLILRQPYIKRQIALFLEATKEASYDVSSTKDQHHSAPGIRSASDCITGTRSTSDCITGTRSTSDCITGTRSASDCITGTSCQVLTEYTKETAKTKPKAECDLKRRSVSRPQDKLPGQRSDEDECSSSTSSTERSEGDCRERKAESSDMQDLVHMMTRTLGMETGDGVSEADGAFGSTALPEFKLNRKYRDTLVLHGKAREEVEDLSLGEIPIGSTSGPAKIRRAIEHLRTDVVKGLGVKLLDRVLEIMEVEDDAKRELCLRDQMGAEKYRAYAVMVRQLKFFEDIATNVS
uniref:non-specific serine/threonine protein kinase n=1 Tax=Cyclopterus lumpus TaxID=8103 RepID=A0A8C2Z352_CYCLU